MIVRFDRRSFRCCAPFAPMPCIISHLTQVTWRNTYTEFTERNETKWNPDDAILSNVVGKKHMKENHSTVHLPIFFWVGFRWDGHYEPEMGGMDPTCHHPKPRPTNPRDFFDTSLLPGGSIPPISNFIPLPSHQDVHCNSAENQYDLGHLCSENLTSIGHLRV